MKIRKKEFENHPILGNLKLDFADKEGKTINTIILAGENAVGKSLLLNLISELSTLIHLREKSNEKRFFEIELLNRELEIIRANDYYSPHFPKKIIDNVVNIYLDYSKNTTNFGQFRITSSIENGKIILIFQIICFLHNLI